MEQQKLPNGTAIIVLSIFGYLCCCLSGLGIIPAAIAFYMANKTESLYKANPELYANGSQAKTYKILALIALILNVLMVARLIYVIANGDFEQSMEQSRELLEQWGIEQP